MAYSDTWQTRIQILVAHKHTRSLACAHILVQSFDMVCLLMHCNLQVNIIIHRISPVRIVSINSSSEVFSSLCDRAPQLADTEYLVTPSIDLCCVFLFHIFTVNLYNEPTSTKVLLVRVQDLCFSFDVSLVFVLDSLHTYSTAFYAVMSMDECRNHALIFPRLPDKKHAAFTSSWDF